MLSPAGPAVAQVISSGGGQGFFSPPGAPRALIQQISRLHCESVRWHLHCTHRPLQAGLRAVPREASTFLCSLVAGPSSLLSTLQHPGLRSVSPPSHSAPSACNALPNHFTHVLTLQNSAPRPLPQRSPLGLTPTFSVAPRSPPPSPRPWVRENGVHVCFCLLLLPVLTAGIGI